MSKIPQGEWNAIAARYAQGESISRIAQSYGCTPPAIHYILKRNKERVGQRMGQPLNGRPGSSTSEPAPFRAAEPQQGQHGAFRAPVSDLRTSSAPTSESQAGREHGSAPAGLAHSPPSGTASAHQSGSPSKADRASAFTAGLDSELHNRAEAAIEAFRASFAAALVERSPVVRQRLRQAASDLMRVAARTTIVLDRLSASAEHASIRTQDHLRSAQNGEHASRN
jgi:transposase-like protein